MELEGQWWKGQLAADIHQALRYKELKLPTYKGQSPQLNLRRYFADLIAIVSNRFKLCPAARHLAVYLLDLFMDRYDISIQQLHVVALSCLLLASKFEEKEDHVPKLEQLNSLGCMTNMNLVLTKQNLLHMELLLLDTFQWNLCLPTAAHFIEYYLSIAVHETDLHDGWPMVSLEKTKLYMAKYADYFLEVSLQDHTFLNYAPSLVAAACMAASRIILRLFPAWPTRLHRLTAYSWNFVLPCIERLLIAHDNDVKEANKQKGQGGHPSLPCVLQPPSQAQHQAHVQPNVSQYLQPPHQAQLQFHHPTLQPQSCQQMVSTAPPTSFPLQTCSTGIQASVQTQAHMQTGPNMSLALPIEIKPCIGVSYNRGYQVNGHYPCITPCFER
ncbi:cyclin-J [Rhinatrema bivittatum]|uniref:cyclin-J n=1 Tax=Rhinatrema bivittatum TaxID=194408 RepID=UPI00112B2B10|nr:cyclin-J [Rhinatrema bivittatum]XP_029465809.1 cyclin-J [Rhinatrema bivittatum]XP_029465811.1 cyclin-J [Rhinatrema bivittatum]XP_029465812.1 cyclin-J [Rhinatrema bivittatum]